MAAAHQGFLAEMETMREIVKLEESCADPAMLQQIKQAYRDKVRAPCQALPGAAGRGCRLWHASAGCPGGGGCRGGFPHRATTPSQPGALAALAV